MNAGSVSFNCRRLDKALIDKQVAYPALIHGTVSAAVGPTYPPACTAPYSAAQICQMSHDRLKISWNRKTSTVFTESLGQSLF
jgi:hypothetical protein